MINGPDGPVISFPGVDTGIYGIGVGEVVGLVGAIAMAGVVYTGIAGGVVGREVAGTVVRSVVGVVVAAGATAGGGAVVCEVTGAILPGGAVAGVVVTGAMVVVGRAAAVLSKQYCGLRAPVGSVRYPHGSRDTWT
jgi:hypothetical protein